MIEVIQSIINELYRIFDILNVEKFDGILPHPVITIQYTKNTYGHFTTDKIWKNKNNDIKDETLSYYEININPNYFNIREVYETIGTLLHEMVHFYNTLYNIKDCSGKNHNKKFKRIAERVDLIVEKTSYGWSKTSCSDELKEFIDNVIKPDESVFEYFRYMPEKTTKKKKRNKNIFKYTCPTCGMEMKGKANTKVLCGICEQILEMEEQDEEEIIGAGD